MTVLLIPSPQLQAPGSKAQEPTGGVGRKLELQLPNLLGKTEACTSPLAVWVIYINTARNFLESLYFV